MRKVCEFEIHIHVLEIAFIDSAYCSASRSEGEEKELCQVIFFGGGERVVGRGCEDMHNIVIQAILLV